MPKSGPTVRIVLDATEHEQLNDAVLKVHKFCPGQSDYRYLAILRWYTAEALERICAAYEAAGDQPVLVSNLPQFEDVERTKILTLLLGQTIGNCVAYINYNGSYLTDIRPTSLSAEKSAGTDLLAMHNDLSWAADACRPRTLVLVPHIAKGDVPRTLLAPATEVVAQLDSATIDILQEPVYEARSGILAGRSYELVRRMALLEKSSSGRFVIRLNFDSFAPAAGLTSTRREAVARAHERLHEAALDIGRVRGHAVLEGEALIIANDECVHGRDPIDTSACERLLLRAYVVPDSVVAQHGHTLISLDS